MAKRKKFEVYLEEYTDVSQLPEDSQKLIKLARSHCQYAYAPFSNFKVSAVVLLSNRTTVYGTNQENAAFPSGQCAERVALFAAAANYPSVVIKKIAITAQKEGQNIFHGITPCGGCLQVMSELQERQNQPIEIIMESSGGNIQVATNVKMLLPFRFTANHLDK